MSVSVQNYKGVLAYFMEVEALEPLVYVCGKAKVLKMTQNNDNMHLDAEVLM